MKKVFNLALVIVVIFAIIIPCEVYSLTPSLGRTFTISLKREFREYQDPVHDLDEEGNRKPQRPISCNISEKEGVQCEIPKEYIMAYEVWTAETNILLMSILDEHDFVDYLFSLPEGDYMLKIITEDFDYIGYIY